MYYKKCLVCSVENKENDLKCKKCSGKLSDIQRILVEAKTARESVERANKACKLTLISPVVAFFFFLIILNPLLHFFGDETSTLSTLRILSFSFLFVGVGHVYTKRYLPALFFSSLIPLALGLIRQTYFDAGMTLTDIMQDNELNFGIVALFFMFIEIWLLIAHDTKKGPFLEKKAPCQEACPASIDIPHYIALISDGKYEESLNLIRENNPLPAVIGRICPHPCEDACIRGIDGHKIAINPLKRFVSDFEREIKNTKPTLDVLNKKNEKVAIIGSGPAGLSAAYYLARLGVMSTIYEKNSVAGGMLSVAIPKYRLPREVLDFEIDIIKDLGVTIETNSTIGTDDRSLKSLLDKGFDSVLIAAGLQSGVKMRIQGEESEGVSDCLTFLHEAAIEEKKVLGLKVVVIGGGNAAIDTARTLLRLGAENVTLLYRRSRKEMPASPHEVQAAEEEGVIFEFLAAPKRIVAEMDVVSKVECIKMRLGDPDSSGRRRPVPIDGSDFSIPANSVVAAIGQTLNPDFKKYDEDLQFTDRSLLKIDPITFKTSMDKVYSAGDCVTGPTTAINAIGNGKKAALSIFYDLYRDKIKWPDYKDNYIKKCEIIEKERAMKKLRIKMPSLPIKERVCSFSAVEKGYSEGMALEESLRCLKCHQELIE